MTNSRQRRNLRENLNIKTSKRKQEREWEKERIICQGRNGQKENMKDKEENGKRKEANNRQGRELARQKENWKLKMVSSRLRRKFLGKFK